MLIVLGMLAFMVVSAVGFSMYMRQSRAPSSYLRRNVASRYLVKAALANAIEDLEGNYNEDEYWGVRDDDGYRLNQNRFYGVYDDPYPGCGPDNQYAGTDPRKNGDYWLKRVFCPFGPVGEPTSEDDAREEEKQTPTAPTLTLEALAYLPPAIVDDVRKVSRLTRTACWRPLPYDAGRFAYTAVNVSDCFDINRLQADVRDSAACRISLASLCTTSATDPLSVNAGDASSLKTAVEKWMSASPDTPFVSLADFALANAGTDYSPFTKFIGGTAGSLLSGGSAKEANALFITDTWFPVTPAAAAAEASGQQGQQSGASSAGNVVYDLSGGHQPFKPGTFGASGAAGNFMEVNLQENPQDDAGKIFEKNLGMGLACLYDYLDRDSVPISLCLPTLEAVPMVIGISAPAGLVPEIGDVGGAPGPVTLSGIQCNISPPSPGTPFVGPATVTRAFKRMGITSFGNQAMVSVLTTYPFKRMVTEQRRTGRNFTVRGLMRVYLAQDGMRSRLDETAKIQPPTVWQNGSVENGTATFISTPMPINAFSQDIRTWDKAVDDSVTLTFSNLTPASPMPLYWEVNETASSPQGTVTSAVTPDEYRPGGYKSLGNLATDPNVLRPLDAAGSFYPGWNGSGPWNVSTPGSAGIQEMTPPTDKFRVQVAVWIQILEGTQVVDMVPARASDDITWLNASDRGMEFNDVQQKCGAGVPLMNFTAKDDVDYANLDATLQQPVQFNACATLYAVDPRFNWAPENWFASDDTTLNKNKWHDFAEQNYWGGGGDRDIFMFVSDQEYLQDIGELQFIPNLQTMNGSGTYLTGEYSPDYNGNPFSQRKDNGAAFACKEYFWSTYTAYDNGNGTDPIYALPYAGHANGVRFHSGLGQFKVNPYSDDDRVIFAAIAGTPADYYVAATNEDANVNKVRQNLDLNTMMSRYSISSAADNTIPSDKLQDIGFAIRDVFQNAAKNGYNKWEDAWNRHLMAADAWQDGNLKCDENNKFLGEDLGGALHGVDRKFLASYWRECFDNRQQLFLIFVRAEPTAVGGGASGSLSSAQLGARAVALVWRDPAVPTYSSGQREKRDQYRGSGDNVRRKFRRMKKETPAHQSRVLFYHQFD